MALLLDPDQMTHDEIVEAYAEHPDHKPLKRALRYEHNYTSEQLKSMREGDYRPDQGDNWSDVKGDLSWK